MNLTLFDDYIAELKFQTELKPYSFGDALDALMKGRNAAKQTQSQDKSQILDHGSFLSFFEWLNNSDSNSKDMILLLMRYIIKNAVLRADNRKELTQRIVSTESFVSAYLPDIRIDENTEEEGYYLPAAKINLKENKILLLLAGDVNVSKDMRVFIGYLQSDNTKMIRLIPVDKTSTFSIPPLETICLTGFSQCMLRVKTLNIHTAFVYEALINSAAENATAIKSTVQNTEDFRSCVKFKAVNNAINGMICRMLHFADRLSQNKDYAPTVQLFEIFLNLSDRLITQQMWELGKVSLPAKKKKQLQEEITASYPKFFNGLKPVFSAVGFETRLLKNKSAGFNRLIKEMEPLLSEVPYNYSLRENMRQWFDAVGGLISGMSEINVIKGAEKNGSRDLTLLDYVSLIIMSFELMEQAIAADSALKNKQETELSHEDTAFYKNKIYAAEYFIQNMLPFCDAYNRILTGSADRHTKFIVR